MKGLVGLILGIISKIFTVIIVISGLLLFAIMLDTLVFPPLYGSFIFGWSTLIPGNIKLILVAPYAVMIILKYYLP